MARRATRELWHTSGIPYIIFDHFFIIFIIYQWLVAPSVS
jgi:hypothetical protein